MKSGAKIYAAQVASRGRFPALDKMGNGDLRSLIHHIGKADLSRTELGAEILATAMCEAVARFMRKGGGKNL